jgi:NAD(P)-dependent dehydrogenase (short-subunit alcohol dehydrogenase family)
MSVLVVTGASKGIGARICVDAARQGWACAVNYASDAEGAADTVRAIEQAGGTAMAVRERRKGGKGGAIVNISSAAAKHGGGGSYVDYAASKGAVDTFTIGLAREQAAEGVRVNGIRPGAILTDITRTWMANHPEYLASVMSRTPLGHPGEEEDIANATLFLLSDQSKYMTGAILDVSGGWVCP